MKFFISILLFPSILFGGTICWSTGDERSCGNSVVFDTGTNGLSECKKDTPCKRLVLTDSHLTLEEKKIEICDEGKCQEIKPEQILRDVKNDIAVLELDISSPVKTNAFVFEKGGEARLESFELKIGGVYQDFLSGAKLEIKKVSNQESILAPPWLKNTFSRDLENKSWNSKTSGHGSFLVEPGTSGSLLRVENSQSFGIFKESKGIINSHHKFLAYSSYARIEDAKKLVDAFLAGERGYDKESKEIKAMWHYDPFTGKKFRSYGNGTHWETSVLVTKTGGAGGIETGGAGGVETGVGGAGGVETGSGGAGGVETGSGGAGGVETDCGVSFDIVDTESIEDVKDHVTLYPGVIIHDKKVIGFLDKKNDRVIFADWDVLMHPDVINGTYDNYVPFFEDEFLAKNLLLKNRPSLKNGKIEKYCTKSESELECFSIQVKNGVLEITPSKNEQAKFRLPLDGLTSKDIFRNVPIYFSNGRGTSLWLTELFLPNESMDEVRDSSKSLVGGDHANSILEVFTQKD